MSRKKYNDILKKMRTELVINLKPAEKEEMLSAMVEAGETAVTRMYAAMLKSVVWLDTEKELTEKQTVKIANTITDELMEVLMKYADFSEGGEGGEIYVQRILH